MVYWTDGLVVVLNLKKLARRFMMTLAEIRTAIWQNLGEPTDLDPSLDTTYNSGPYLTWVANEAQRQIAKWKDKTTGRHLRIRSLQNEMFYYSTVITETISAVNNDTFPYYIDVDEGNIGSGDDRYNGWVLEVTSGDADGDILTITDYDSENSRLYVSEAFSSDPAADDTIKLYKRFDILLPSEHSWVDEHIQLPAVSDLYLGEGNLIDVLSIVDMENDIELEHAGRTEKFPHFIKTTGNPTKWYRYGNKIYYNINIDENIWYRLEYYRMPANMTDNTDEPEIPSLFHWAMVLWGRWWGLARNSESSRAYSAKLDWEEEMKRTKSQYDISSERIDSKIIVKYKK
jgi:hypothetical protein